MDRLIYTAMGGAQQVLGRQAAVAQNLANASTNGYRAIESSFRAVPLVGEGLATRTYVVEQTTGANHSPGALQSTGRALDVALQGAGWIAVQTAAGTEAYTRNGNLQVSANGQLQTRDGLAVLGDGGPISVPPEGSVSIAADGTVSLASSDPPGRSVTNVGRIKLVNPDPKTILRGDDGLFRLPGDASAEADASVRLVSGSLEGSNVNLVEEMISMISLARQFDLQMQLMSNAERDAAKASEILNIRA